MSERMSDERLAELRDDPIYQTHPTAFPDVVELIAGLEAEREEVERLRLQLRWTRKMGAALLGKPLDLAEIEKIEAELARPVFRITAPDRSRAIGNANDRITELEREVERLRADRDLWRDRSRGCRHE